MDGVVTNQLPLQSYVEAFDLMEGGRGAIIDQVSDTLPPEGGCNMRLFGILAIAILLSACGGAAAPSAQSAAPTTAATTAATAVAAAATTAPVAAATPSGPNIADLLKAGKLSAYKVTYKWTITSGGQTQTSEQTWYYKAPKARFDFSAGPGSLFSVFTLPDGSFVCTTAGGQSFCQKSPGGTGLDANPAASFGFTEPGTLTSPVRSTL